MSLTRLALRFAAPAPKVEAFDRYLFIGPHPDDIEVGAGATAAKLVAAGKQVCFLICTDGRYGLEHAPESTTPEALIELRKAEAVASAKLLGVEDVRFLEFSDGGFYDCHIDSLVVRRLTLERSGKESTFVTYYSFIRISSSITISFGYLYIYNH